jgi:hypothetical protein
MQVFALRIIMRDSHTKTYVTQSTPTGEHYVASLLLSFMIHTFDPIQIYCLFQ